MRKRADQADLDHGAEAAGLVPLVGTSLAHMGEKSLAAGKTGLLARFGGSSVGRHLAEHSHAYDAAGLGLMALPAAAHFGKKLFKPAAPVAAPKTASAELLFFFGKYAAAELMETTCNRRRR